MKFTNKYIEMELIPVYNTGKATLFKFDTILEEGDVVLNVWLPNWSFINDGKILKSIENKKEKYMDVNIQIIEEFNYKVFNKDLEIEKTIDLDELIKLTQKNK